MNILTGIQKFLNFINENWTLIASIITIGIVVYKKIKSYFSMSKEKQIEIAKAQIKEVMLMLVTQAEFDYQEFVKAGSIKRSQVIDEIFAMFAVLSKVTHQEEIVARIDNEIDESLKSMREIFAKQTDEGEAAVEAE